MFSLSLISIMEKCLSLKQKEEKPQSQFLNKHSETKVNKSKRRDIQEPLLSYPNKKRLERDMNISTYHQGQVVIFLITILNCQVLNQENMLLLLRLTGTASRWIRHRSVYILPEKLH